MTQDQRPKILIVDDESHQLDALERTLRADFRVVRADSGEEALRLLVQHADLAIALSDLRMPGVGGLEVLAECKRAAPSAVRAAVSGAIDVSGMAAAINSGSVDRFILKPWEPELLRLQMLEALRAHEAMREKLVLERLASTDALTEVANRRHFDERLKIELDRSSRHGRPVALALVDVDGFKPYNDRLGHQGGDELLRRVTQTLAAHVRSVDFLARYGGDEFAIIMPDSDSAAASVVAERLRRAVESSEAALASGGAAITVSIGIAGCPEHARDPAGLVGAADRALYRAKGQGRNQTVVAIRSGLVP